VRRLGRRQLIQREVRIHPDPQRGGDAVFTQVIGRDWRLVGGRRRRRRRYLLSLRLVGERRRLLGGWRWLGRLRVGGFFGRGLDRRLRLGFCEGRLGLSRGLDLDRGGFADGLRLGLRLSFCERYLGLGLGRRLDLDRGSLVDRLGGWLDR
jgi:hypothetical protein